MFDKMQGFVIEKVPRVFLRGLSRIEGQFPIFDGEIYIVYEDLFAGFADDGKPKFKEGRGVKDVLNLIKQSASIVNY